MRVTELEKEIHRECERVRRLAFPEAYLAAQKRSKVKHGEKYAPAARARAIAWNRANKDQASRKSTEWAKNNPEKRAISRKKWFDKNPTFKTDYQRNRRRSDPDYRLLGALRSRVWSALKGKDKSAVTLALLGCSIENLWIYLESKFEPSMTRENYGSVWHVDHIMPCAIFDLSKPDHQKRCFHFSNLQPLFPIDNFRKGAQILKEIAP